MEIPDLQIKDIFKYDSDNDIYYFGDRLKPKYVIFNDQIYDEDGEITDIETFKDSYRQTYEETDSELRYGEPLNSLILHLKGRVHKGPSKDPFNHSFSTSLHRDFKTEDGKWKSVNDILREELLRRDERIKEMISDSHNKYAKK